MNPDKLFKYALAAVKHPGRMIVCAYSEVTRKRVDVCFNIEGHPDPISVFLPDSIGRYLYLMGSFEEYEPETNMMLDQIVKRGDTAMIVGAHIGTHAIKTKRLVGETGTVVAFEPTPNTYGFLQKNCLKIGIKTENMAVTNGKDQRIDMVVFDERHSAWNSSFTPRSSNWQKWQPRTVSVPAVSIDVYCDNHELETDILLLDMENGEREAIVGSTNQILEHQPSIIIECGDKGRSADNSTRACLQLLESYDYSLYEADMVNNKLVRHKIKQEYPDEYQNVLALHPRRNLI
ncbi:FkbM family methyltransferase [Candidatus Shapirobacteria bacterium]|nr:FkbM family methyltransferase [Candidatus Shapirobacteria bacterium]